MVSRKGMILLAGTAGLFVALGAIGLPQLIRTSRMTHPATGRPIQVPGKDGDKTLLHSGWRIQPAGRPLNTGDFLLGPTLSPDGRTLAVVNAGYNAHNLHLVDVDSEKSLATLPLNRAWNGVVWAKDGKRLFVSGGISNPTSDIHVVAQDSTGAWKQDTGFRLTGNDPQKTCIAGLGLSQDGMTLFALNNSDNCLYVLDATTGESRARVEVGDHPVVCRLSRNGGGLFVANWGGSEVALVDVSNAAKPQVTARYKTDEHPNDLALTDDGRLFVSCGSADSVVGFDMASTTEKGVPQERIKTTLTPKAALGSTPNALALSPDNKTLYVANADNNNVCVIDISRSGKSRVRGFLPSGWYPTAVAVSADGKKVLIGSGKGTVTGPNPVTRPINTEVPTGFGHHGRQLSGFISFVDTPTDAKLVEYTRQVYACTPYKDEQITRASGGGKVIPAKIGDPSPIKYVLYIVKENRTYDQVFGDLKQGNGDPSLCLFGREITPNQHALAEQFVLLDNLYCTGEVSQDGHPWSSSAYVTDFTQRSWVLGYSGKGRTIGSPTVNEPPGGYIWEAAKKKGLSYRSYGWYTGQKSLVGHHSERFSGKVGPNEPAPGRDYEKADVFIQEFKEFEKNGNIPHLMVMSLGENHTRGTTPGANTPKACVASNDVAVGKIVEAISRSSVWKEFAIFIIEDDAQNGPDHVDSHRTTGLVISPYTQRAYVDSTMYSTMSMLRTMGLILGLTPLTQHDAAATPMFASFADKPNLTPFTALPARIDMNAKNPATAYGAKVSAKMDWSVYDRIDEDALNRILWHSIKGTDVAYPTPVRRALHAGNGRLHALVTEEDEDD